MVSRYVQPGTREGVSLNVVDYEGIRYIASSVMSVQSRMFSLVLSAKMTTLLHLSMV